MTAEVVVVLDVEADLVMTGTVKNRCIARDIERTRQLTTKPSTPSPDTLEPQEGRA